jgi:hypothetical protein
MLLRNISVAVLVAGVLSLSGCIFKKKKPPIPAQSQPPAITAPAPQESQPATTEAQPPPAQEPPSEKAEAVPAPKPKPKRRAKKTPAVTAQAQPPPAPQQQASASGKLVIQEGGSPNQGQLAPNMTGEATNHHKQTTQQLLDSTEANLKGIKRTLTPEEQAMVAQIKDYMEQSRKATVEADLVRAHNLALKARLLSDELVKR